MIVAADGDNFYDIFKIIYNGYIQSSAAKVKYQITAFFFLADQTGCQGSSRRFVDQTFHMDSGQGPGLLCGIPLVIIKISGNTDDCFSHFRFQKTLCIFF